MIPANEHDEMTAWAARVRTRNTIMHVKGIRAEEAEALARHKASAALTATEICLSCLVIFAAVYLGLGTL